MRRGVKDLSMETVESGLGPRTGVDDESQDLRVPQIQPLCPSGPQSLD